MKPKCTLCKKRFEKYGAILLSPPKKNMVKKFHICCDCYKWVKVLIERTGIASDRRKV